MKPAIPLRGMFCIFFTYIFVFGAQGLIIAFLSFSYRKQIKTSQQFFQSQLFCKQQKQHTRNLLRALLLSCLS